MDTTDNNRLSNFEFLRILAMVAIIGEHLYAYAIRNIWNNGPITNKIFSCLLLPGGQVGVAIFFMITGYFYINKDKIHIKKIITETFSYAVLETFFYIILLLCKDIELNYSSIYFLIKYIFTPATGNSWWFVTSYIFLMLMVPTINKYVLKLKKTNYKSLIIISLILWYVIPMNTTFGSAVQRPIFFYILGAYIKLHTVKIINNKSKIISILEVITLWLIIANAEYLINELNLVGNNDGITMLLKNLQFLLVPFCAYFIFKICESFNIKNKMINKIASTTFGIYLFHEAPTIRFIIWKYIFSVKFYSKAIFPLYAILMVFIIFTLGALLDLSRQKFFQKKIDKIFNFITNKLGLEIE